MRRNAALAAATVFAAALALGGCSWFKKDDKKEADAAEEAAPAVIYAPAETVKNIEIGTTRDGYVITAHGFAEGLGYGAPELRPRRDGQPGPDGFIDYDLIAQAPHPAFNLGEGELAARAIRADLQVKAIDLRGVAGIRVHGIEGGVQLRF